MSRSILLVEDDLDVREATTEVLQDAGYKVVSAVHGGEALDYLRRAEELPGLILLDLMMPIMDGWQFRVEQEKDPRLATVPVVVMSAVAAGQEKARPIRPAAYLPKPVELDSLLDVAARFCGPPV